MNPLSLRIRVPKTLQNLDNSFLNDRIREEKRTLSDDSGVVKVCPVSNQLSVKSLLVV